MMTGTQIKDESQPSKPQKLGGYDFYRSIGSPRCVVAPMVDQSELAWRMLSRAPLPEDLAGPSTSTTPSPGGRSYPRYPGGAHLCYTPMIHAKVFSTAKPGTRGADGQFDLVFGEEGSEQVLAGIKGGDRPLFVQFCANDPDVLLAAAKMVEAHCDAVDINFGCPQGIARRGHYGSFLQDDWELIQKLIGTLHENLSVPVTAKFRIHPSLDRTIAYAKMMEAAGAQILTVHGRTREMKGQQTGLADWEIIRKVKEAVNVPVFANGNILYAEDVERCLEVTGCDGVMSAEGNLSNPALFLPPDHAYAHPPITLLAHRYLDIVSSLKTPTGNSAIKSHLFRVLKPYLSAQPDEAMRIRIGRSRTVDEYRALLVDIEAELRPSVDAAGPLSLPPIDGSTGYRSLPIWRAQPYIRPTPQSTETAITEDGRIIAQSADLTAPPSRSETPAPGEAAAQPSNPNGSDAMSESLIHCSHTDCRHIAAIRCPHRACLTHCRTAQAIKAGMEPATAAIEASKGGLEGEGCEPHEEKVRARKERLEMKRKGRAEGRRGRRAKARKRIAIGASPQPSSERGSDEE